MKAAKKKLWGGRFDELTDLLVEAFTESVSFDWRLYPHDIEGSIAVRAGESPVIGIVVGADIVFRDGWMRVHEGSGLWVGAADRGPTGSVEVRFAPDALLDLFGDAGI